MGFFTNLFLLFVLVEGCHLAWNYGEIAMTLFSQWALTMLGFKVDLESIQHLPPKFVAVTSHTSIYDFVIASFIYHGYMKAHYDIYFLMKDEFARHASPICRRYFPYMYIVPVQSTSQSIVTKSIDELKHADNYILAITPEGTRSCVPQIRSGFYYIAKELKADVVFVGIDFHKKTIAVERPRKMGDDIHVEKEWFISCCRKYIPLYPENCYFTKYFYETYAREEASFIHLSSSDESSTSSSIPSHNSSVDEH